MIAAGNGGQQRTAADDLVQVRHSKVLLTEAASWLRDEEANARVAMPTAVPHPCHMRAALCIALGAA
jgi:hypothetical protein